MSLISKIESILFVASKPLTFDVIAKAVGKGQPEVEEAVETLVMRYNDSESGINVLREGDAVMMATNPANSAVVDTFIKDEVSGELTRAQLESLTVIAYQGPITRPELEQIRGVNCALILRNLLVRGLIEGVEDKNKLSVVYKVSFDALRHLGVSYVKELPEYTKLHGHQNIEIMLNDNEEEL